MPSMRNPTITNARAVTRITGSDLAPGETTRIRCPYCDGGRSHEQSFYVTRTDDGGSVLYICHRASCGKRGRLSLGAGALVAPSAPRQPKAPVHWTGRVVRLCSPYWQSRYDAACQGFAKRPPTDAGLFSNEADRDECVWILRSLMQTRLGVQLRKDSGGKKRVDSYKETDASLYAYFSSPANGRGLWLVEDCLSAAALQSHQRPAVALLGTYLHNDLRDALSYSQFPSFHVALDPGAERDAGLVKERLACYTTRPITIHYLKKDIKNMTRQEQVALMYEAVN